MSSLFGSSLTATLAGPLVPVVRTPARTVRLHGAERLLLTVTLAPPAQQYVSQVSGVSCQVDGCAGGKWET